MIRRNYAPVTVATYLDAILTDAADDLNFAESLRPIGSFDYFGATR